MTLDLADDCWGVRHLQRRGCEETVRRKCAQRAVSVISVTGEQLFEPGIVAGVDDDAKVLQKGLQVHSFGSGVMVDRPPAIAEEAF
jgi:hypothetical protein